MMAGGQEIRFAVLCRPRTQALLDGRLKSGDLPIRWVPTASPLGLGVPPSKNRDGLLPGGFAGGEMSISSFMRFKSQRAPILALPVFLKRGIVQRSLFCAADSTWESPKQLAGKRIGSANHHSSMPTWVRGVLEVEYQLARSSPQWISVSPLSIQAREKVTVTEVPEAFTGEEREAWEELDGYAHPLERRENFLLTMLERGELDAAISYQVKIHSNRLRPLFRNEEECWSHYSRTGVYPINHLFVIHEDVARALPDIGRVLLATLREARKLWVDYLPGEKGADMKNELDRLGWDPFDYRLGEVEKRTLQTFMEYVLREGIIFQTMPVEELFLPTV